MDNLVRMHERQAARDLRGETPDVQLGDQISLGQARKHARKRPTRAVLHLYVKELLFLPTSEVPHYVWMFWEQRRRLDFSPQLGPLRVSREGVQALLHHERAPARLTRDQPYLRVLRAANLLLVLKMLVKFKHRVARNTRLAHQQRRRQHLRLRQRVHPRQRRPEFAFIPRSPRRR